MKHLITKIGKKLLPADTKRRIWVKHFLLTTGIFTRYVEDVYQRWIKAVEPLLVSQVTLHKYKPLISIIVPTYNTPDKYLVPLLASVKSQTYGNWELCIADGSSDHDRQKAIEKLTGADKRMKYQALNKNLGIAGNTNAALKMAKGEFIAFLDHDDVLAPFALNEAVTALQNKPKLDLIYSDEDLTNDNGKRRFNPFFKPDWSPDLMWALNYITHFVVARRSLVEQIGGLRAGFDGAQDYDFLLRLTENTNRIHHIPKMLYHWRMAEGSTAKGGIKSKTYALDAGLRAIREAMIRRNLNGTVHPDKFKQGTYRPYFQFPKLPKIALVLPATNPLTSGLYLSKFIGPSGSSISEIYMQHEPSNIPAGLKTKLKIINQGDVWASAATGESEIILGVQQPFFANNTDWLEELVGVLQQAHVGAVTGLVLDNNDNVLDFGLTKNGSYSPLFKGIKYDKPTLAGFINWPRNFIAISGGIFAIRKAVLKTHLRPELIDGGKLTPDFFYNLTQSDLYNTGWPYVAFKPMNIDLFNNDSFFNSNLTRKKAAINLGATD